MSPRTPAMKPEPMAKPTRSLVEHTADVLGAFAALFGTADRPTDLARRWLAFFRLPAEDHAAFARDGRLACYLHDWGKANSGFAAMLGKAGQQAVRHEVVSALLIARPDVWRWLEAADVDLPLVLAAVAGHHLKAAEPAGWSDPREFAAPQNGQVADFTLTWDHPAIRAQVAAMAAEFGLAGPWPGGVPIAWRQKPILPTDCDFRNARTQAVDRLEAFQDTIEEEPASARSRRLRAVRSALIAADSAGSGLFRTHEETGKGGDPRDHIRDWIDACFDPAGSLDRAEIEAAVIEPSRAAKAGSVQPFAWNEFQEACADPARVPARSLLIAPCGSGKTLAAWRWIAARAEERPIARAIFLYPTRGTATEGFRDYAAHAGEGLAALVHGTADLDLDAIEGEQGRDDRVAEARLFSLRQWPKRVFSATADQFLAFLQHDFGSTCLLPLLADSAIVMDEVHSYDRGMFTALTNFLEHFDAPVLAMTATLIEQRKAALKPYLRVIDGLGFGDDGSRLRRIAGHPRYEVATVADREAARREAEAALAVGKRVLWVVNTVDRAQALACEFAEDPTATDLMTNSGARILGYHSRFKLVDRRGRHAQIVGAFRGKAGDGSRGILGVSTQVCEMSLDLDCDVLITEHAPVSSLIQRFGRCCRDQDAHESGRTGRVLLYEPETPHPYGKDDWEGVPDFIAAIAGDIVSQGGLEDLLLTLGGAGFLPKSARFVADGAWACAGLDHFRDIEERTCQAILPGDQEEYRARLGGPAKWRAQELLLPIPNKKETRDDADKPAWVPRWLTFADTARHAYSPALGYIPKAGGGFQIV